MQLCLVLPPLTQLNTPYPSTGYLARYLRQEGIPCSQRDLGIELILKLFSKEGLRTIFDAMEQHDELPEPAWRFLALRDQHEAVIDSVVRFLQGKDGTLARRILETSFLPGGPRLEAASLEDFGPGSIDEAATYIATLYFEDIADLIGACVDEGFSLTSYQRHLGTGPIEFTPLEARLQQTTLIDKQLDALTDTITADVVGLSIPFPGNLYGALRIAKRLKERGVKVVAGGGYVNTELREVNEPALWNYFDALTYDDGEAPLKALLHYFNTGEDQRQRTRTSKGYHHQPKDRIPMTSAADFEGLKLDHYLKLVDTLNPAHRLWSDGRWNKITLAHGCYWKKCSFCDTSLDYISHYENASVSDLVDTIEEVIAQTGNSGFHFVDEAAPPKMMKAFALELLRRRISITWWGNIRFEKTFTPELCRLLSAAGLVAVTGGLEVASNRLLELMQKGVSVEQVAQAAQAFQDAGVLVHAYLMYGFPTQTDQETVDSMELVRQLFATGLINSAFWHRFVVTRHAPVHAEPGKFKINILPNSPTAFANNDLAHEDPTGANHDRFDDILPLALRAWMKGKELQRPVHTWFDFPMPPTTESPQRIQNAVGISDDTGTQLLWIGGDTLETEEGVILHSPGGSWELPCSPEVATWIGQTLDAARPQAPVYGLSEARSTFPGNWNHFSPQWEVLREAGLLLL